MWVVTFIRPVRKIETLRVGTLNSICSVQFLEHDLANVRVKFLIINWFDLSKKSVLSIHVFLI